MQRRLINSVSCGPCWGASIGVARWHQSFTKWESRVYAVERRRFQATTPPGPKASVIPPRTITALENAQVKFESAQRNVASSEYQLSKFSPAYATYYENALMLDDKEKIDAMGPIRAVMTFDEARAQFKCYEEAFAHARSRLQQLREQAAQPSVTLSDALLVDQKPSKGLMRLQVGYEDTGAHRHFLAGVKKNMMLRLNDKADKSDHLVLSVSAIGGSGKTEFLYSLQQYSTVGWDGGLRGADNALLKAINEAHPANGAVDDVLEVVVLMSTMNQAAPFLFDTQKDAEKHIESRVVLRMASMLDHAMFSRLAAQPPGGTIDFQTLAQAVRELAIGKRRGTGKPDLKPHQIAVVFCVDEALMIPNNEVLKALLYTLAAQAQADVQRGLPTLAVVSSLDIAPISEILETNARRSIWGIPLRPLRATPSLLYNEVVKDVASWEPAMRSQFEDVASTSLEMCGGHPRSLFEVYKQLKTATAQEGPTQLKFPKAVCRTQDQFDRLYHWLGCEALQDARGDELLTWDWEGLDATDRRLMSIHCLQCCAVGGNLVGLQQVPAAWLLNQSFYRKQSAWKSLHRALFTVAPEATPKVWEKGILAAIYLRLIAIRTCTATMEIDDVMMTDVFPGAQFFAWGAEQLGSYELTRKTATHFLLDEEPALVKAEHAQLEDVFQVSGMQVDNQEVPIDAILPRFCTHNGKKVSLLLASLDNVTTPGQITAWVTDIHLYAKTTLDLEESDYLVLLFCTGALDENMAKIATNEWKGVLVMNDAALQRLLKPFGASVLARRIAEKTRQQQPPA